MYCIRFNFFLQPSLAFISSSIRINLHNSWTSFKEQAYIQRYTNADLKIYRYLWRHTEIICRRFCVIAAFTFWVKRTQDIWNVCLKTYRKKRMLKELRNRIIRNILVWSLLCLIRLYAGLHFLRFLLEN